MANYCGTARTNYVRVKDKDEFKKWAEGVEAEVVENDEGKFALLSENENGEWSRKQSEDDDPDETDEWDFFKEISRFMAEGQVLISMHVGYEKMRYLNGVAEAVDWRGNYECVSLGDIYNLAATTFDVPRASIEDCCY